ncbi:hypothetical protein NEDG_01551 [Nematocida displodere]|uniref:Uncharacterized protein n=1 Tax=Nematocida displodere TaxID=1805483 RepID=A0A177EDG7_9MICR|nr:hypothetical protein NEDG_01551 [Nematocida displodere]
MDKETKRVKLTLTYKLAQSSTTNALKRYLKNKRTKNTHSLPSIPNTSQDPLATSQSSLSPSSPQKMPSDCPQDGLQAQAPFSVLATPPPKKLSMGVPPEEEGSVKDLNQIRVVISNRTYILHKREAKTPTITALLSKYSSMILYLAANALLYYYISTIYLLVISLLMFLKTLEKVRIRVTFKKGEYIKNALQHVLCYVLLLVFNLGQNLTVVREEE